MHVVKEQDGRYSTGEEKERKKTLLRRLTLFYPRLTPQGTRLRGIFHAHEEPFFSNHKTIVPEATGTFRKLRNFLSFVKERVEESVRNGCKA